MSTSSTYKNDDYRLYSNAFFFFKYPCLCLVFYHRLTPSSGAESVSSVGRDHIEDMEKGQVTQEEDVEGHHYKPAIHPDTMTQLIRRELETYKVDIRISVELQCFIHLWLEERLFESFRMNPECDVMLMMGLYDNKRMPLGAINIMSNKQPEVKMIAALC